MNRIIPCLIVIVILSSNVFSKGGSKVAQAHRVKGKVEFDGKLTESFYKNSSMNSFTQLDPEEGKTASEQTEVWMHYDENYIYISAKLKDSEPDKIDASLIRRDEYIPSDWFYVFLDPYHDRRTGFYFAVNAGGSRLDGTLHNDSWRDSDWDGIWEAKTVITSEGWTVEMRVPFSQLRFQESDDMTWGINFNRRIKRKNESSYFIHIPKKESGFVSRFADLKGLKGIKAKQRLEILPYIVQKAQYLKHESDDPFYKSNQYKTQIGADVKIGFGSNLTIDATILPDFGQVEVDPAEVNLSAFETFYREKRPFFIEGSNIFSFGFGGSNNFWGFNFGIPDFFYSRRIGGRAHGSVSDNDYVDYPSETRILGAAKVSGKLDESWSIGALSAVTERSYATLAVGDSRFKEEVEPLTHYGVFRSSKEFAGGKRSIGVLFTGVNRDLRTDGLKSNLSKQAYTLGLDGWSYLDDDETYVLTGTAVASYVNGSKEYMTDLQQAPYRYFQRPDRESYKLDENLTSLSGYFSRFMINKQKGNFYLNTAIGAISPKFDYNDLGFQWMSDRINGHVVGGYTWFDPDKIFRRKSFRVAHYRTYNFEGDNLTNGFYGNLSFQFLNYWGFNINSNLNLKAFSPTLTRGGPLVENPSTASISLNAYSDSRNSIIIRTNFNYVHENAISYYWRAGINLEWKPSNQINLTFGPSFSKVGEYRQWVNNIDDPTAVNTFNTRYVFGDMERKTLSANIRLNWTFTPQLSLQLFLQPYFTVGKYASFKELLRPRSDDYFTYTDANVNYNEADDEYTIDPDAEGEAESFTIGNPDFNFKSLRGNLVLRYEVVPGSIFYLVWTHDKTNSEDAGRFNFNEDFKNLLSSESNNIFLVKFSYWFDM